MPTSKDSRPRVVPSRAKSLKLAETELLAYKSLLSNSRGWLARADRAKPNSGSQLFKDFEKAKAVAERTLVNQQRTITKLLPIREVYIPIDWGKLRDVVRPQCQTFKGLSTTLFAIVGTPLELPNDGDTDWGYDGSLYSPPSRSYQSLMYKHWLRDKTHWYSFDAIDMLWVLHHLGYEFPAPKCNGTMSYEANISIIVTASDTAEFGFVSNELLVKEIADANTNPSAPATFEAYDRSFGQLNFTSTDYKTLDAKITGSFKVKAGKKSRVWFGISGICAALDGFAGTNGYCYLMVKPVSGEAQPGVKYAFVPD